jgi:chromosome segregation ATPase
MVLSNDDLQAIAQLLDNKIGPIKEDVSMLKEDVSGLKEDVSMLKEDVSVLKQDVAGLKEDVSVLKEDVTVLKEDVTVLKSDVAILKDKVEDHDSQFISIKGELRDIRLTIENEITRNIRFIAEGHLDLIRKLDAALKIEQEKEMFSIRLTSLENDVRILKQKCL